MTDVVKSRKETVDGKEKRFIEKTPWETWIHDQQTNNGGGSNGGSSGSITPSGGDNGGGDNGGDNGGGGGDGGADAN